MRVPTAAIFALTVLSVQGLTNKISATQDPHIPTPISEADNFVVEPVNNTPSAQVVSLATRETLGVPQIAAASGAQIEPNVNSGNNGNPQQFVVEPVASGIASTGNPIEIPFEAPARAEAIALNFGPSSAVQARSTSPLDVSLNQPFVPVPAASGEAESQSFIVEPQQSAYRESSDRYIANNPSVTSDVAMPVLPKSPAANWDDRRAELRRAVAIASAVNAPNPLSVTSLTPGISPASLLLRNPTVAMPQTARRNAYAPQTIVEPRSNPISQLPDVVPAPPPPPLPIPQPNPRTNPNPVTSPNTRTTPSLEEITNLRNLLRGVEDKAQDLNNGYKASPSLTVVNPAGYGIDNNTGYIGATFQSRTRYSETSDGGLVLGVGLGNARKAVGVELSYTAASFGGSRDFGAGGLNVKIHRQISDDLSVAVGWNGLINIGGHNDFKNSIYASGTKVFRVREDITKPFSRVAVTAGLGSGRFRSENDVTNDRNTVNPFGSVAVRIVEPVSAIVEWTGQDLAVGASIVPFKNIPFVITPALRDIAGAGDGARFVLGAGFSFKF